MVCGKDMLLLYNSYLPRDTQTCPVGPSGSHSQCWDVVATVASVVSSIVPPLPHVSTT